MNGEQTPGNCGAEKFAPWNGRHAWPLALLLVAITLLAYGPAWHAGFIWDDDAYLTHNPLLTAPDGLRQIWFSLHSPSQYFPLTYTTFYFEHRLWGLNPTGYHIVNLLLHAANALLVWGVLARLRVPGAWLAAAIFALHPVQVESVAWITERKNVLMGLFFLLALWEWLRFIDEKTARPGRHYVLALLFCLLSLSAKTTACTLPAALLLILWLKKIPIGWRRLAQVAPFVALGMGMGLVTVWWERYHQGTQGKLFEMGAVDRVLLASRALWFYLGKLLWPTNLTFSYPHWTISASDAGAYGWVAATIALGVVIGLMRRKWGRGPETAALFFAATLSPIMGFIMLYTFLYSFVADHYQYLACLGPIALASAGLETGLGRVKCSRPFLRLAVGAVLLVTLGTLTWRQSRTYDGLETLWRATIERNPDSWMAHNNLAGILLDKGQMDEAIAQLQKTLAIRPDFAEAQNNLAYTLLEKGQVDEAIIQFQKTLTIDPNMAKARFGLAQGLAQQGQLDEAIMQFQKGLAVQPENADAHQNLGKALLQQGQADAALVQFQKALALQPHLAAAHNSLGIVFAEKGQMPEAAVEFQKAVTDRPDYVDAHNNLGRALAEQGKMDEAILHFKKALELAIQQKNSAMAARVQAELEHYTPAAPAH